MVSEETQSVIARAKEIFEQRLRSHLEANHRDQFVAIEPDSGEFFVADTFDAAVKMARSKYPSRVSHTIRIGHAAAFHIGVMRPTKRRSSRTMVSIHCWARCSCRGVNLSSTMMPGLSK